MTQWIIPANPLSTPENMSKSFKLFLKHIALFVCWILFSPLFLFFASKWSVYRKSTRMLLFIVSPFGLAVLLMIVLIVTRCYSDYQRKHKYSDHKVLERITGVPIPQLRIVEYFKGETSFNGDYSDVLILEMAMVPDVKLIAAIDSLAKIEESNWKKSGVNYTFSVMWGNGIPAPEGEDADDDTMLSITIAEDSKIVKVSHGSW